MWKQVCGQVKTGFPHSYRLPHSCLSNGVRDVQQFAVFQTITDGPFNIVVEPSAPWLDGIDKLVRLFSLLEFVCSQPHQHGLLQCVYWILTCQPWPQARKERTEHHGARGSRGRVVGGGQLAKRC